MAPSQPVFLDAAAIDSCLNFAALRAALSEAFCGAMLSPPRQHYSFKDATQLVMPSWSADVPARGSYLGAKIVSVHPGNGAKGLPSVQGLFLLQDGETGTPLAMMDAARLTLWRTAAASALAATYLARPDAETMLMAGAGQLAPFLVRAHCDILPLRRIWLWNRNREAAARLVLALQPVMNAAPSCELCVADDLAAAAAEADIISCATLSRAPLIRASWLRPGVHLDLVGAFAPGMREVDDETLRAARIFLDTDAACVEGGDVADGLATGAISTKSLAGVLADLCLKHTSGRTLANEVTLFKSIGTAIEDLAAAVIVWQAWNARKPRQN
ncbi:MAG: ornithine cyclodeaminase family protein [Hyphomicrobiales bacterium]|nr:ornithine cyclodeaminase family protein [Hyphomicrobiales bacterium]